MEDLIERARTYLDRRTAVTLLATTNPNEVPEVGVLVAPKIGPDGTVAGGEEESVGGQSFRNLRQSTRATLLVLDPIMDPRSRDGVRIAVEFLGAEQDGPELDHLTQWLATFAPGRRIVRRLLFKVLAVEPYRLGAPGPVVVR
jgi:hypothetical protein